MIIGLKFIIWEIKKLECNFREKILFIKFKMEDYLFCIEMKIIYKIKMLNWDMLLLIKIKSVFLQLDDGRFVTSSFDKNIKVYGKGLNYKF